MIRALALGLALCTAVPATAADDAAELAESRLRGCLLAGSSAAPQTGLREAVISVRSFCTPQIKRVQGDRVKAATTGLSGEARKAAEHTAIRALNDEIALAIANFTGLTA
ncbi:MAG: hypothetical protein ACK4GD_05120 [Sphingomonadaceae bacterium]